MSQHASEDCSKDAAARKIQQAYVRFARRTHACNAHGKCHVVKKLKHSANSDGKCNSALESKLRSGRECAFYTTVNRQQLFERVQLEMNLHTAFR